MPGGPMDSVENLPPPPPGAAKQKVAPDAPPPPPPSKVAEPGEVAAAISAAGVTTVKEEAVNKENRTSTSLQVRDAILEGNTALNIETKADSGIVHQERHESTSGEKEVPQSTLINYSQG